VPNFNEKLGTINYKIEYINKFRHQCKNVKLRHIYFRLIMGDFFTKERMFKYKMVNDNRCVRCGGVETFIHLLWECGIARIIWQGFNEYTTNRGNSNIKVTSYDEIFEIGDIRILNIVKMKIIQIMIQIVRPTNMTRGDLEKIEKDLRGMEAYNLVLRKS
jgi:hypothetical protein